MLHQQKKVRCVIYRHHVREAKLFDLVETIPNCEQFFLTPEEYISTSLNSEFLIIPVFCLLKKITCKKLNLGSGV